MRIKSIILSLLLIAGASTTAFAADAPDGTPSLPADSTFTWSGPYAGINGGWAFDARTRFDRTNGVLANNVDALNAGLRPTAHHIKDKGFTAGGQIGFNYQVGDFDDNGLAMVLGAEADLDYTDLNRTDTLSNTTNLGPLVTPSSSPYTRVNQFHSRMNYFGTARGRLGIASRHVYAYGTVGFAYGHVKRDIVYYGPNSDTPFFAGSNNGGKGGYVYGGGMEFAVPTNSFLNRLSFFHTSAVTLKAEFLRYHLGDDTLVYPGVNGGASLGGYSARVHNSGDMVRAGINYKF